MAIKFTNNATTTLASSITASATSIPLVVGTGALFPAIAGGSGDHFYGTLVDSSNNIEIVKVTARSTDTLTVIRGQDGTTAKAYIGGDKFELRPTAAALEDVSSGMNIINLPANTTMGGAAIVTPAATQTLTNKTLTSPTINSPTIDSPNLTGIPTAPTASAGTNTTQIATTQFVASAIAASPLPAGTRLLFQQTNAPTGWTKDTTHNDKALRVVNGSAGSGGSVGFTSAFTSQGIGGTVGSTTLTVNEMPSHTHDTTRMSTAPKGSTITYVGTQIGATGTTLANGAVARGGSGSHSHSFSGTAINLAVQYVDVIIAVKS